MKAIVDLSTFPYDNFKDSLFIQYCYISKKLHFTALFIVYYAVICIKYRVSKDFLKHISMLSNFLFLKIEGLLVELL